MDIASIIGIILMLLVAVWFTYELIAFIRTLKKRISEKKSTKEVKDDVTCDRNDSDGDTECNN